MAKLPSHLTVLINFLKKLPGVGSRTAERYAFNLLNWQEDELVGIGQHIAEMKRKISHCSQCHALIENQECPFCDLSHRDGQLLCVVATPQDIYPIEDTRAFRGIYYVLGALLSPLQKHSQQFLRIDLLKERILQHEVKEVIIALDSTIEGDATTLYLKKQFDQFPNLRISRLAAGLPLNSTLDFVDGGTLTRAFSGRHLL